MTEIKQAQVRGDANLAQVMSRLDQIGDKIDNLSLGNAEGERSRPRERIRGTERRARAWQQGSNGLCYYHDRFGNRADKCRSPCRWSESENSRVAARM